MIASLLAVAACWWMKDGLPDAQKLHQDLLTEPKQVRVSRPAIDTTVNGVEYRIQPRYSYDMRALVVSLHDSDTWWDYAHKAWNDNVNRRRPVRGVGRERSQRHLPLRGLLERPMDPQFFHQVARGPGRST
jgi:hypothetical protein